MGASEYLIAFFVILNIISLAMYGSDKRRAIRGDRRIPERTLLLAAVPAPWGAVIGMQAFRHKTRKPLFKLVYVLAAVHLAIALIVILRPF